MLYISLPYLITRKGVKQILKTIKLKSAHIENFKGIKCLDINFTDWTKICGQNASGKTSVVDGIMWCLFDKDSSGNSKFEIRTLDASGEKIHHTEIKVNIVIDVDGEEHELSKTQKEKWVKKRGQEQQEFSGNQNVYEMDGFPKSDKEYKAFIAEIVDESVFKLLTNPMAFTSLDWKEQRKMLMSFVDDVTPEEVASAVENFELIASDISVASVDDCKKKYSKARKELTDQQKTIPVRIDELERQKFTVDVDALRKQESEVQAKIDATENDLRDNPLPSIDDLNDKIKIIRQKESTLENEANRERLEKLTEIKSKLMELRSQRRVQMDDLNRWKNAVAEHLASAQNASKRYEELGEEFKAVKSETFDESQNVCQYCGQDLPEDRQEENRKRFINQQEKRKAEINAQAITQRDKMRQARDDAKIADARMKECNAAVIDADKTIAVLEETESAYNTPVNVTGTEAYKKLLAEMETVKDKIAEYDTLKAERDRKEAEIRSMRAELNAVREQIALEKHNENIDARIAELRTELRNVSAKLAQSDQLIYVLENYVRFLAEKINSRFDGLTFKLFENQINGGIKECCEVSYNGVPYSSLNSGHRIVVGLEIIKTLQELHEVKAPIFIDNSEMLNTFNMPKMDCQVVELRVTDDKELTIN